jgi:hypothetical protein
VVDFPFDYKAFAALMSGVVESSAASKFDRFYVYQTTSKQQSA